jgi:heptaprenyl diphosphate synthase
MTVSAAACATQVDELTLADVVHSLGLTEDLAEVDAYMMSLVQSPVLQISEPARHVISAGGKRLRAALVLMGAKLNRYDSGKARAVAAATELLHAASLVHDDIIDQSPRRRGLETVHKKWYRDAALVGGDYLFALAASAIAQTGDIRVLECLGGASVRICEGEISLVRDVTPLDETLAAYKDKIAGKTAVLFEESLKAVGYVSGASDKQITALGEYGHNVGMAFQIIDDVLDYVGASTVMGKPVGGDLRRRQITLPLILAANDGMPPALRRVIDRIDDGATEDDVDRLLVYVQNSQGIDEAIQEAERYCELACQSLACFPPSAVRDGLKDVACMLLHRRK